MPVGSTGATRRGGDAGRAVGAKARPGPKPGREPAANGGGVAARPRRSRLPATPPYVPVEGAPVCADPGRLLIYQEVLSRFMDATRFPPVATARCRVCKAVVACVAYDRENGEGTCLAQAAITSKYQRRLVEGAPVSHLSATIKGSNAFNEKDYVIVASAGGSRIATKVPPLGPLPEGFDARWPADLRPAEALRDLILNPPPVPYAAVMWAGRKASVPIKVATFRAIVVVNGGENPIEVDRRRFARALAASRLLGGLAGFEDALALREAIAANEATTRVKVAGKDKWVTTQALLDSFAGLRLNDLAATLDALPGRGDPETRCLRDVLRAEARVAARAGGEGARARVAPS